MKSFTTSPIIPLWLIICLLCAACAAAVIQYLLARKKLGSGRACVVAALRLAAFSMLILPFLNVSFTFRKEHTVPPAIAVLLDTSRSMDLPGRDGKTTRLNEAKGLLVGGDKPLLQSLSQVYDVKLYALGASLRRIEKNQVADLTAAGERGDLKDALKSLYGQASLVLLMSDGAVTGHEAIDALPKELPTDLPVVTVPVGDPQGYRDILVSRVKAPAVAFRGREASIDVVVKSHGYKNLTVPVIVRDGGTVVTAKNVRINESPFSASVTFSFTPTEVGTHNISVSVPPQVGESMTGNNGTDFPVRVVRDKIRILMASGSPSLNYRFMRLALKNDPSIDLLSFVILRTPSNIINVPLQEQSLIPFPVDTLFSGELKTFDLLIFDNLAFHLYLNQKHLEAIREFVRGGGAFAMIGGPHFSDEKRLPSTPLGEMLPVGPQGNEDYSRAAPAGVRPTSAGLSHPVTLLTSDRSQNQKLWQEMPPLDGFNLLTVKGSGTALLESSTMPAQPILTVGTYGKGRVLALGTDYFWKWNAGMVAAGKDNWVYLRFVERVVRWLTRDPALEPVTLLVPDKPGEAGQEVDVRINPVEDDTRSRETVLFSVFNPEGVKIRSQLRTAGTAGALVGTFRPEKKGMYRVRVETRAGSVEETVVVSGFMEGLDAAPDHEALRTTSASTGGKLISEKEDAAAEVAAYMGKAQKRFIEERQVPLWGTPYLLALIIALLALEWYLRRRWGLV